MDLKIGKTEISNNLNNNLVSQTKKLDTSLHLVNQVKSNLNSKINNFSTQQVSNLPSVSNFELEINNQVANISTVEPPSIDNDVNTLTDCFTNVDINKLLGGINLNFNVNMPKLDIIDMFADMIGDKLNGMFDFHMSNILNNDILNILTLINGIQDLIPKGLLDNLFESSECLELAATTAVSVVDLESKLSSVGLDNYGKVDLSKFGISSEHIDYLNDVIKVSDDYNKSIDDNLKIPKKKTKYNDLIMV